MSIVHRIGRVAVLCLAALGLPASGQEAGSVVSESGLSAGGGRFRLRAEIKLNARDSASESVAVAAPSVPFSVVLRTASPSGSLELSNVALIGEADLTPDISGKVEIHVLDLYNRNPSSSDDRIAVREAWLRFGKKPDVLKTLPGTSVYVELGKFPRFSKQLARRMESYGLWGTAVGRLEEVGLEAGGSFGEHVYWRGSVTNGNPLFMRDPNALAGDNGTPERTIGSTTPVVYQSGFPILYDTKATDVNFNGHFMYGGGAGVKFNWGEGGRDGVDVLGWYFERTMADHVPIRGSFYSGDLDLLGGFGGPRLPVDGNRKYEYGGNLEARMGGAQLYAQVVRQSIAGLVRHGYEIEGGYRIPLNGLFVSGDSPVVNWIQPTVRVSAIDNDFGLPPGFIAPSLTWKWRKYDFGFRLGILRGVDLTVEYARHDTILKAKVIHPDELLATLRIGL